MSLFKKQATYYLSVCFLPCSVSLRQIAPSTFRQRPSAAEAILSENARTVET